jgi:hypothetical protein
VQGKDEPLGSIERWWNWAQLRNDPRALLFAYGISLTRSRAGDERLSLTCQNIDRSVDQRWRKLSFFCLTWRSNSLGGSMTKHSTDTEAERLLALSEKVGRVAESLAELALEHDSLRTAGPSDSEVTGEAVSWLIRARRKRARYVPAELLGEPVWDIMLHLLCEEIAGRRVSVSDACLASGIPDGPGRRWLDAMAQNELVALRGATNDDEVQIELTPAASTALRRYFRDIVQAR